MAHAWDMLTRLLPRDDTDADFNGRPEHRTRAQNYPTLLVSWWCTGFALAFILVRLWGRAERVGKLLTEDKIMALSILPLLARMAFVHPILLYGTNNTSTAGISDEEAYHRSLGSRFVLCSRILYAMFIWTAKWTVSEYLKRITSAIWTSRHQFILHCIRIFLIVTFLGVVIGTLSECQPFDHYWQVIPDPGPQCRNGFAQLLVMGISDIITDIVLIAFPLHLVITSSMSVRRKIGLCVLFSFSLFLIAITAYRMPAIINAKGRQQLRTLWASIEILAASAVSNALVLGSFIRDKGVKRAKYRGTRDPAPGSRAGSTRNGFQPSINREMTKQHWGNDSDENLFRCVRGRLDSVSETVVSSEQTPSQARPLWPTTPRPAGKGSDTNSIVLEEEEEEAAMDVEDAAADENPRRSSHPDHASITPPESARTRASPTAQDFAFGNGRPLAPGDPDSPILADVGGLLHSSPPPTARASSHPLPADPFSLTSSSSFSSSSSSSSSSSFPRDFAAFHSFHYPDRAPRTSQLPVSRPRREDVPPTVHPAHDEALPVDGLDSPSPTSPTGDPSPELSSPPLPPHTRDPSRDRRRSRRFWRRGSPQQPRDEVVPPSPVPPPRLSQPLSPADPLKLSDAGGLLTR